MAIGRGRVTEVAYETAKLGYCFAKPNITIQRKAIRMGRA